MANATKYVDNVNGNNGNTGNSEAQAYADIATALGAITGGGNVIHVQSGSNYSISAALSLPSSGDSTDGRNRIEGYTTTPGARDGRPTITSATNSCNLIEVANRSYWDFVHLNLTHTAGTRGVGINSGVSSGPANLVIEDLIIDGCSYGFLDAGYGHAGLSFLGTEIKNSVNDGILLQSGADVLVHACKLNTNGRDGFRGAYNASARYRFEKSEFRANTGRGIYMSAATSPSLIKVSGCTVRGNGSSGLEDAGSGLAQLFIADNVWYLNGAYGIKLAITTAAAKIALIANRNNAFGGPNTSGNLSNCPSGYNEITLSGDPFTSSTDSTPNSTAGSGALLRNAGLRAFDVGAFQHADSGGSAGMLFIPDLAGV